MPNEAIERLPDELVELRLVRDDGELVIGRDQIARRLSLSEKLDRVVPIVASRRSIKGLAIWADFKRLGNLRDGIVHLKERGYSTDADDPSVLARLALGEAETAVSIAARVIEAAEPGWIQTDLHAELTAALDAG
jgi:hypothetical protein